MMKKMKPSKKESTRTKATKKQLKNAGLTKKEMDKLQGKKK
jgi:hypothetical protein